MKNEVDSKAMSIMSHQQQNPFEGQHMKGEENFQDMGEEGEEGEKNGKREIRKTYYEDGTLRTKMWYRDDKKHREDGPAHVFYCDNGNLRNEEWYRDGKKHREDGPA